MRIILITLALALLPLPALGAAPLQVPLQGVIRDNAGVPVVEDVFEVTFSLYDAVDAADPVWTETWPPAGENCTDDPGACVHVVNGRFRLALGAHSPLGPEVFVASNGLWLGMKVETDPELDRRPLGSAPYALHAATSASASSLDCTGCIPPEALSNETVLDILDTTLLAVQNAGYVHEGDLAAGSVPFDGAGAEIVATDVQGAIEELKDLIEEKTAGGAGQVNEGAGQVVSFPMSESVPSYGTATQYVHLVNPSTPKVITHLYGDQAAGGGGAGNLVVAYDFAPNQYSAGASGDAGDNSLHVDNPSLFNTANHVLIHQTRGGSGTTAGTWEVNAVLSVNGNNLLLVKDLENTYVTDGTAKAQVVLASSFGTLEVVGGGSVGPAAPLAADGSAGGIVYIRANQLTVKNGGVIHADGAGFAGGIAGAPSGQGSSQCGPGALGSTEANCGGGGAAASFCASGGGGGNQAAGETPGQGNQCPGAPGVGGETNTDDAALLQMGGGGGGVARGAGGAGGGLVVLGAKTVIVETGGRISADGGVGTAPGAGGGAGGTVALYTEVLQNEGEVSVSGAAGVAGGGEWSFSNAPYATVSTSFNTYSHGGGYSSFHDEFWYPEYSGNTVYRMKPGTYEGLGQFSMPQSNIMQIWGMPDGGYLAAQWSGSGYVYRVSGIGGEQLWQSAPMQHDTGGACFDGEWIWSMDNTDNALYQLDPETGNIENTYHLSNISGTAYGGLVCVPGRLYRMDNNGCMRIYDLSNKNYLDTVCGFSGADNTSFDGQFIYTSPNNSNVTRIQITTSNVYVPAVDGGSGGAGWLRQANPIPGVVNESYPKGVRLLVDGNDVTASVGDPNGKGPGVYDSNAGWGASGLDPWSSGPLDVTNVANWTLGEHTVQLKETGGAGGKLKMNTYVIYPFTESTPPLNDTCSSPLALDPNSGPVVTSGTTEDVMGKTLATDASVEPGCGGQGGPDVVYRIDLTQRSLLHAAVVAPFPTRLYLRADSCVSGSNVYCADGEFTTNPIEAGTYFLFVDSNAPIAKGDFTLAVSTTPAVLPSNDTCEAAEDLVFTDGVAAVSTSSIYSLDQYDGFCATDGSGPDVVYHFTTDQTYSVTVDFQADFSATTYLMSGACSGQGAFPSVCNQQGIPAQFLPAGDYWLIIDGNGEKVWGDYTLTVTLN